MKAHRLAFAAVLLTGTLLSPLSASLITLTGTVRDFKDSHPDFEAFLGADPGIVEATIGADRKPVYAGTAGNPTTTGATNFDQWYRDVSGVNLSKSLSLTLDSTITADPNVYTYTNSSFFPIDGELFGNQGRSHNYHFTFELHAGFTYQGGEVFSFTGDDDVWVFINDELVIDLGGVHGPISGAIALDSLGLTVGNDYDFDLFFAERHTTASNFRMDTSIVLEPQSVVPEPTALLVWLLVGLTSGGGMWWQRKNSAGE